MDISKVLKNYDKENISIGVLGGHSALDVCSGAKKYGFKTVCVAQKGRDKTYSKYYKTRFPAHLAVNSKEVGCIDEVILVDKFSDITKPDYVKQLQELNTIFIHNRYFWVYFDFDKVENDFNVPIYGRRELVKLEERDVPKNQYYLLEQAGIRIPKIFKSPKDIDRLAIIKVNEAQRKYERAFFLANSDTMYKLKSSELLNSNKILQEDLNKAVIEEFILGAQVNFNFFYSNLTKELELMGTDTRRQTNLDGLLRLPADVQLEVLKYSKPTMVETGHITVTTKESILEKAFTAGEKFVSALEKEGIGMIGPFALQGAIDSGTGKEEFVVFDVSMRIPGSPGTMFTPHTSYLYGKPISYGERIAMEIHHAIKADQLDKICT